MKDKVGIEPVRLCINNSYEIPRHRLVGTVWVWKLSVTTMNVRQTTHHSLMPSPVCVASQAQHSVSATCGITIKYQQGSHASLVLNELPVTGGFDGHGPIHAIIHPNAIG